MSSIDWFNALRHRKIDQVVIFCLFEIMHFVPVNNFSVMSIHFSPLNQYLALKAPRKKKASENVVC